MYADVDRTMPPQASIVNRCLMDRDRDRKGALNSCQFLSVCVRQLLTCREGVGSQAGWSGVLVYLDSVALNWRGSTLQRAKTEHSVTHSE